MDEGDTGEDSTTPVAGKVEGAWGVSKRTEKGLGVLEAVRGVGED